MSKNSKAGCGETEGVQKDHQEEVTNDPRIATSRRVRRADLAGEACLAAGLALLKGSLPLKHARCAAELLSGALRSVVIAEEYTPPGASMEVPGLPEDCE